MDNEFALNKEASGRLAERISGLSEAKRALLEVQFGRKLAEPAPERVIPRMAIRDAAPLSFAQQRFWFWDQTEPGGIAYNESLAFRLRGFLHIEALKKALDSIVTRHEVLRTTFAETDGVPVQVISKDRGPEFVVTDLRVVPAPERDGKLQVLLKQEARRPFNLSSDLMLRASVLKLKREENILLLVMHHIATDGWSAGVLWQELSTLYEVFCNGRTSLLAELPIQYSDFAVWQRNYLQGEVLANQLAYWKEQLRGAPQSLDLPTDRPRPKIQSYRGAIQTFCFPEGLSHQLKALSREKNVTLFMTLLAAFQILLYRYTGQEDIIVGSPIAGRTRDTKGLIGCFINTVLLRGDLSGDPTFAEFLARIRDMAVRAYQHQDVPFEKIVEELHPQRDRSRNPLFQVMLVFQNLPTDGMKLTGLDVEQFDLHNGTAKFDLKLDVFEDRNGLRAILEYSTDLFEDVTISRMIGHFQTLLQGIVANPNLRLSELPLLTRAEQSRLLVEWNDSKKDYPTVKGIHELFEAQVERTPDAVAVVFEDRGLTYRELNQRANQLAHYLGNLGVGPDVLVGICAERSLEMVIGLLGILKAGAAYVPLDPGYPKERLAFMLQDAQVPVLLTQAHLVEGLPDHGAQVLCLDSDWEIFTGEIIENPARGVNPENLAYVIYTSGSTGLPKGAMNTHKGICNRLLWMQEEYRLTEADRVLQKTPFSFDVSVWEFFWPLLAGARLVVARPGGHQDSVYLAKLIAEDKITTIHFVPSMLQVFIEEPGVEENCVSLKRVICSGEALPSALQGRFFNRLDVELHNLYGPTEAAVDVTFWACERESNRSTIPIGRPIANTQIYILDSHLQLVPIGVPGELCIGGLGVGRGYLNRPELTAEKFIKDPFSDQPGARLYRTGDLAKYLPDGNIEYLGRMDNQVKIRGFRIELGEIETVLSQHPGVRETVVVAQEDMPGEKRLVAYIVPPQKSAPTTSELRDALQRKLPDYMVPSAFVFLDSMPKLPNGKIDRRSLPAPVEDKGDNRSGYVPPNETLDFQLVEIWEEFLGIHSIGIRDNFFDLGGHSLLALQMIHRVEKICGEKIALSTLLAGPTIEHLRKAMVKSRVEEYGSLLVKVQSGGAKRPFFFLHSDYLGGGFFCLNLARGLGEDQPFYALTPHGLNDDPQPPTVEAMAADFLKLVRSVQPAGPYVLGGVCGGGVIVFEMAQQLRRQGQKVDLVILVGPSAWNPPGLKYLQLLADGVGSLLRFGTDRRKNLFLRLRAGWILFHEPYRYALGQLREVVSLHQQMARALRFAAKVGSSVAGRVVLGGRKKGCVGSDTADTPPSDKQVKLNENAKIFFKAMDSYVRRCYPGKVVIFWPVNEPVKIAGEPISSWNKVRDKTLGWGQIVSDLEFYEVPGGYITLLTRDIKSLAEHMKVCLDKVQVIMGDATVNDASSIARSKTAKSCDVLY